MNAAIAGLPDPSLEIRAVWGCEEEANGDGSPRTCYVTPMFDDDTAAGWVKSAMKLYNQTLFCILYRGNISDGTSGAQLPMCGCHSSHHLGDILQPAAENMIDTVRDETDNDAKM